MDDAELLDLAIDAASRITKAASKIAVNKYKHEFGNLAAKCTILYLQLSGLQQGTVLPPERLHMLLSTLECWRKDTSRNLGVLYPTLRAWKEGKLEDVAIERNLIALMKAKSIQQDLLHRLDKFFPPSGERSTSGTESSSDGPDGFQPEFLSDFFHALSQNIKCVCPEQVNRDTSERSHKGYLQLAVEIPNETPVEAHKSETHVVFHAVLVPPRCHLIGTHHRWQLTRIQISRREDTAARKVHFTDQRKEQRTLCIDICKGRGLENVNGLCKYLLRNIGAVYTDFCVKNGNLFKVKGAINTQVMTASQPSLSLAEALTNKDLSDGGKILLAYIIATAVWQYYDSDWMQGRWTADRIQFLPEKYSQDSGAPETEVTFDPLRPYVSMPFDAPPQTYTEIESEYLHDVEDAAHRAPRILALGIILVNLMHIRPRQIQPESEANWISQLNDELCVYSMDVEKPQWPALQSINPKLRNDLRKVAKACLDKDPFLNNDEGSPFRRQYLFEKVVRPLASLVSGAGFKRDGVRWVPRMSQEQVFGHAASLPSTSSGTSGSEAWLREIINSALNQELNQAFRRNGSLRERTKIAILDTGYDPRHTFFNDIFRKKRITYKDFVSAAQEGLDQCGHGSHLASVIMRLAPSADLYIARIARDNNELRGLGNEPPAHVYLRIANAISWAANNSVDIVSMSFGFLYEDDARVTAINTAIDDVCRQRQWRILCFAAASNEGGNSQVLFPANSSQVIPIRATDHQGVFQKDNAPRGVFESHVFGTLGEDVLGASPNHGSAWKSESGSSVATATAAGIAALIIDATRLSVASGIASSDHLDQIRKKDWMLKMFLSARKFTNMGNEQCFLSPSEFCNNNSTMRAYHLVTALQRPR